jgi:ribosomal protein L11 methyltransferase
MRKLCVDAGAEAVLGLEQALMALEDERVLAVTRFENGPILWRLEAYCEAAATLARMQTVVVAHGLSAAMLTEDVAPTNWVRHVEAMLSPVRAGVFMIHGPHDREAAAGHANAIEIEAGEAFGTAHHGSTEGCLFAITHVVPQLQPRTVLDLGTGTGVLAIAVARLAPNARVLATDIDPRAVEIAADNGAKNGVSAQMETLTAAGLDHPRLVGGGRFDLIVANILAGPLIDLAPGLASALHTSGRIILSGLLDRQAPEVLHAYAAVGCAELNRVTRGEWVTLVLGKEVA